MTSLPSYHPNYPLHKNKHHNNMSARTQTLWLENDGLRTNGVVELSQTPLKRSKGSRITTNLATTSSLRDFIVLLLNIEVFQIKFS